MFSLSFIGCVISSFLSLAHRYAETRRYMDFVSPGSQAKEGSFFGLEASLEGLEPGYFHFQRQHAHNTHTLALLNLIMFFLSLLYTS